MSIPQLQSFSTGFSGLSKRRIFTVASAALPDLPLRAMCPFFHDFWPPWLSSFMHFGLCGSLCLEPSAFISPHGFQEKPGLQTTFVVPHFFLNFNQLILQEIIVLLRPSLEEVLLLSLRGESEPLLLARLNWRSEKGLWP